MPAGDHGGTDSAEPWAPAASLQTYTAVYYVLADLLMLSLFFHYKFTKRPSQCEWLCPCARPSGPPGGLCAWEEVGR